MNLWAAVILAALLLDFAVERLADVLNLGHLGRTLPPELRDAYDADRYHRAQGYARARTRFGILVATVDLAALLAFWFARGFDRLDQGVRGLGLGGIASGLVFIGALGLARAVLALPFGWWSTFVIEERFGFNRTTPRTFCADVAKGALLALALGGPLLAAVLWLLAAAGARAWLWCWLASALFLTGVQVIAPTWILPLFNRFTPLPEGRLREAILAYARGVGFPLEDVFVIDGSRRSTKGNAFFTGFGRHKRVALFDTLIERLEPGELVAVLAHEVGHYRRGHVVIGLVLAIAQLGLVFWLLSLCLARPGLFAAFFMHERPLYAGIVFCALLFTPAERVLAIVLHAIARRHEAAADAFAVATTGTGERLASALKRLAADALTNPTPHPLHVALHHSHPPVLARVRALTAPASARID
ncbi:MAG TPA: M48 family metallopeptidase [Verrucomicrobiae bacterium]|nr:M48 family metallopeptidase [Verrucomicrobiae bacterium]